jgi:hypothetical protein
MLWDVSCLGKQDAKGARWDVLNLSTGSMTGGHEPWWVGGAAFMMCSTKGGRPPKHAAASDKFKFRLDRESQAALSHIFTSNFPPPCLSNQTEVLGLTCSFFIIILLTVGCPLPPSNRNRLSASSKLLDRISISLLNFLLPVRALKLKQVKFFLLMF